MLWSDPPDEPPEDLREAQAKLHRASWLLAATAAVVLMVILGVV